MTLTGQVAQKIITKLLKGEDYRIEIVTLINADFLQFTIDFFKTVVDAKIADKQIDVDWYKKAFLNDKLPSNEIAINSGLNMKTIRNMFNTSARRIVIDASSQHYDTLFKSIKELVEVEKEIDLSLTIKFKSVSVELNVSETLIIINTLAVKRAALRGGYWSTAGKRVEKPLMQTLCALYQVSEKNQKVEVVGNANLVEETFEREIDFYLCNEGKDHKCEVKLMGIGNPESADAVIARASEVFVADKLSDTNKAQLNQLNVQWTELRDKEGYKRFESTLKNLKIPYKAYNGNLEEDLSKVYKTIFRKDDETTVKLFE